MARHIRLHHTVSLSPHSVLSSGSSEVSGWTERDFQFKSALMLLFAAAVFDDVVMQTACLFGSVLEWRISVQSNRFQPPAPPQLGTMVSHNSSRKLATYASHATDMGAQNF